MVSDNEATARIEAAKGIFDEHTTMCIALCDGGEPWAGMVFFVEDEPDAGHLDMCCMVVGSSKLDSLRDARVAVLVAGEQPSRWIQGVGTAEVVSDDADAAAVRKRLEDRTPAAAAFFDRAEATAVRIHIERLRATDLGAQPPVTEFTFA
jgi:hypothetical protein